MGVCYLTPKAQLASIGARGRGSVAVESIAAGLSSTRPADDEWVD